MKEKLAEFWVCAEPKEVTQFLRLEPTSIQINQPYSYWRLQFSGEDYGVECISALLKVLETREKEIIELASKFAVGVVWVGTIEPDMPDCENQFNLEAEEMGLLSRLHIPLCVQAWRSDR
ncbi:MAG TPA: hypothetical protein V6D18_10825 [Thermosynechococcaceae cyanobacterium]